jgi:prolyl oligopeptidase
MVASRDATYVVEQDSVGSQLRRIRATDDVVEQLKLPFAATVSDIAADTTFTGALIELDGWSESPRWFADRGEALESVFPDQVKISAPDSVVEEIEATSRDGTRVPLTIISKGPVPRDGSRPTLLFGYGAYEESIRPAFSASRMAWVEQGGVTAVAHVRGGGERGRQWHLDGMREKKQNSIDDFVACAEYLVRAGYSSADRLGAVGDSAGGLLVGVAAVQRPALFRAIATASGMVNLERMLKVAIGPANSEEFGSEDTEEGRRVVHAMDAYAQVRTGVRYPAAFVSVGMNDPRVPLWQGAKFAAKLQASSTSGYPVLLRVREDSGHGGAESVAQRSNSMAEMYAFFAWQLASKPAASSLSAH